MRNLLTLTVTDTALTMALTPEGRAEVKEALLAITAADLAKRGSDLTPEHIAAAVSEFETASRDDRYRICSRISAAFEFLNYDKHLFDDLLEYYICNGWSWVQPEQIGALTAAPIITDELSFDDHGEIDGGGRVFAYMSYAVHNELEELWLGPIEWVRDEVRLNKEVKPCQS